MCPSPKANREFLYDNSYNRNNQLKFPYSYNIKALILRASHVIWKILKTISLMLNESS